MRFLGLDLGTKTGALVELRSELITDFTILKSWTNGPKTSQFTETLAHIERIATFPQGPGIMGVDWSPYEVFLRGNRLAIHMKAFYFGYITHKAKTQDLHAVFITPGQVRKALGLKSNVDKIAVHSAFRQNWPMLRISTGNEHEMDALILAWVAQTNFKKAKDDKTN